MKKFLLKFRTEPDDLVCPNEPVWVEIRTKASLDDIVKRINQEWKLLINKDVDHIDPYTILDNIKDDFPFEWEKLVPDREIASVWY